MWLQAVGTHDEPLDPCWIENGHELLNYVWSTPAPTGWSTGDLIVYYASGHGKVVAIMEAIGRFEGDGNGQWGYRVPVRPLVTLSPDVAPRRQDLGLDWPRTYKRLSPLEFERLIATMTTMFDGTQGGMYQVDEYASVGA
jgi:hypothetical protein